MFFNVLRYDIVTHIIKKWYIFAICLLAFIGTSFIYVCSSNLNVGPPGTEPYSIPFTLGEYLFYPFAGTTYNTFPLIWLICNVLVIFIIINFGYNMQSKKKMKVLIYSQSRVIWWLSKCLVAVIYVWLYFAMYLIATLIFCAANGGSFEITVNNHTMNVLGLNTRILNQLPLSFGNILLCIPISLSALAVIITTLSLIIKPIFSFVVAFLFIGVSSFYSSPLLLGNYTMLVRSSHFMQNNGMDFNFCILYSIAIMLAFAALGAIIFKFKDIRNGG